MLAQDYNQLVYGFDDNKTCGYLVLIKFKYLSIF